MAGILPLYMHHMHARIAADIADVFNLSVSVLMQ